MTAARLTAAQARRLGIGAGAAAPTPTPTPPAVTRRRRRPEPYATTCHDCGERFTTQADETRHLETTTHRRYQLELALDPDPTTGDHP